VRSHPARGHGEELRALIDHGRALLAHGVETAWARGLLTDGEDGRFSNILGAGHVRELIGRIKTGDATAPAEGSGERGAGERGPIELRSLRLLIADAGPSQLLEDVVAILIAPELDAPSRALAGFLREGSIGAALTIDCIALALGDARMPAVLKLLSPGAALRRHHLVDVSGNAREMSSAATVRLAPRVLQWLLNPIGLDDEVAETAALIEPTQKSPLPDAAVVALEPIIEDVHAFLVNQRQRERASCDYLLRGPRGSGRSEAAREACRRLGIPVLVTSLANLVARTNPGEAIVALLREETLTGAQLLLEGAEALTGADEASQKLRSALGESTRPLIMTSMGTEQPRLWTGRKLIERSVGIVGADRREAIWRETVPTVNAAEVASLYRAGVGAILRIADGARARAEIRRETPGRAEVDAAVRSEFETDLGTVATRVDVSQTWNDVVLPDDTGRTIAELVDQLRHRSTVLGRWGFQRKLGKGLGTTALFTGEPGTGKSMVAGLIAKELGLELYQIDLSRVLSKWIGETEKNLARVFDAAETGHVLLLFDEADSLLGKRTSDVKNANDRYSNIETNYILQRLEAFHGIAVLTSNMESGVDPALSRRLSFELRFPFPDEEHRAELWRRMLPDELPIEGEIDFVLLARRFEIAGGHIRNIVLRAAFLAAAENAEALAMRHLLQAAEYEYRDHGMLVAKGKLPT
jgi:hypothetical protein